jgi:hypothetical protein
MSTIGTITVPESDLSLVFPLPCEFPFVTTQQPSVVTHNFNAGDRKIQQRFLLGANTRQFQVNFGALPKSRYQLLVDFFQSIKGPYSTFLMADPNDPAATIAAGPYIRVRLADETFSLQLAMQALASGTSLMLVEVPVTTPSYTMAGAPVNRFPGSTLNTALLSQTQQIIPLVKIVPQTGCPPIYISDQKVTVSGTTYEPRLLDWSGIGQSSDGASDTASFSLGNADRVFSDLTKTINIFKARIEFSLFHVGTLTKIDLWAGDITSWSFSDSKEFRIEAADGLWETRTSYPARKIARSCWKTPQGEAVNGSNCPFTGTCNRTWDTPAVGSGPGPCGAKDSFGGIIAPVETAYLSGWARIVNDNSYTAKSIIDDNAYGKVVPEVYMSYMQSQKIDGGVTSWERAELPVDVMVMAVRAEKDADPKKQFLVGLGIVGEGFVQTFGGGHTLNGSMHHGAGDSPPSQLGLRVYGGSDPTTDPFNLSTTGGGDISARAAGTSFIEIRTHGDLDPLKAITNYNMKAYVLDGMMGWYWQVPGTRAWGLLSNPIWIAMNMVFKAKGIQNASVAVQESYFDVAKACDDAAFCDDIITKVIAGGNTTTRKRYEFRGVVRDEKALKDWLIAVLNTCLGGFTFSFGKLRTYLRENSGAVSAFTEGNILMESLQVAPISPAFNQVSVQFGNLELEGVNDAVTIAAHEHARLVGSNIAPSYTKSDINLVGISSRDEAAVWSATRLKEELGGANTTEWNAARKLAFKTTILALETEPGMVCSLTHPDVPENEDSNHTHEFRINNWKLNKDYSIDIQGQSTTDRCYDMLQGPNPADISPDPMPVIETAGMIPPDVDTVTTLTFEGDDNTLTVPVKFHVPTIASTLTAVKAYVRMPGDATRSRDAGRHDINFDAIDSEGKCVIWVDITKPTDADSTAIIYIVSCSTVYEKALDVVNGPHTASFVVPQATTGTSLGSLLNLAPNVTSATATVGYSMVGNGAMFNFSGVITLPTSLTNLKGISVQATCGDLSVELAKFTGTQITGSTLNYVSANLPQPIALQSWKIAFVVSSGVGITAGPLTLSGISVAASAVTAASFTDNVAARYAQPDNRLVWTQIELTPTFAATGILQPVTYWISKDNGVTFIGIGWTIITSGAVIKIPVLAPGVATLWKVACSTGAINYTPVPIPLASLPATAFVSSAVSVAGLALPLATDITSLTIASGVSGSFPYNATRSDNSVYWSMPSISFNDSGSTVDKNAFFVRITCQDLDSSGATIAPESAFAGTQTSLTGQTQTFGPLMGDYLRNGLGAIRTANIASVRFRVYVCNRIDQTTNSFSNGLCATLQSNIDGAGHSFIDVLVAAGGGIPVGPIAPNLTSATAVVNYQMTGNDSTFGFHGSIDITSAGTSWPLISSIEVVASLYGTGQDQSLVTYDSTTWTSSGPTFSWSAGALPMPTTTAEFWQVKFVVHNSQGARTPLPLTIGTIAIASSISSGTVTDNTSARTVDPITRLVSSQIEIQPYFNGSIVPQMCTYWISTSGTSWIGIGFEKITSVGQIIKCLRLTPSASSTWYVACCAGAKATSPVSIPTSSLPAGCFAQSFSITGLPLPSASAITTATVGAAVAMKDQDGHQWVSIPGVTWTDATDINAAFTRITVQCVDASGTAAPANQGGTEVVFSGPNDPIGDLVSAGATRTTDKLEFDYNPSGSTYTYMQYRMYVMNRNATSTSDWSDGTKSVLQTTAWSGAAYKRVSFGSLPAGAIPPKRMDSSMFGNGVQINGTTGNLEIKTNTEFSFDGSGNLKMLNVDLTKVLSGSYSSDFHIDGTTGKWTMNAIDMSKATNLSSQFAVSGGVTNLTNLSAALINTGQLQVGGGGSKVSQFKIFDTGNNLIGFIGDDSGSTGYVGSWFKRCSIGGTATSPGMFADSSGNVVATTLYITSAGGSLGWIGSSGGFNGAWFKQVLIGGSSPGTAKIVCDSAGNVTIAGNLISGNISGNSASITGNISGSQITAGTIIASVSLSSPTITVTSGSTTVNIDGTNGLKVSLGSYYTNLNSGYVFNGYTGGGTAHSQLTPFNLNVTAGSGYFDVLCSSSGRTMSLTDDSGFLQIQIASGTGVTGGPGIDLRNGANLRVSGVTCINSSKVFVGTGGVDVGTAGISCGAYAINGGYFGGTFTFLDQGGTTHSVKGGILLY